MFAKKNILLYGAIYLLTCKTSTAQFYNLPNDYSYSIPTEAILAQRDASVHAGIKPYIHFYSNKYGQAADSSRIIKFDAIFTKHLIRVEPKNQEFKLRLDPLLNLELGKDLSDSSGQKLYNNTRGFIASGYIGHKFYFETLFAENQSMFPSYINDNAKTMMVVPGQGRWKTYKKTGYDYAFSSGFISVQALKNLNIQVGHGKHKIGNGYRSLLLSDNAFNYPFARITQQWFKGRVQYHNIYAVLMNLEPASIKQNVNSERLFQKKAASFQYLSFNANKYLNIGFFQGMIWQAGDKRNQQHLDWQYFNPVIYTNLASFGFNHKNNILIGCDVKLKVTNHFNLYGQLMADDLKNSLNYGNGWGFQGGFNYYNVLGVNNLFLQGEINYASKVSYLSPVGTDANQSYSHYNQSLSSIPLGGKEVIIISDYKWRRLFFTFKYNYQINDESLSSSFKPNNTQLINSKVGYLINKAYNFNISVGINYRMQNFYTFNAFKQETTYLYIGLKTSLYNLYYDF